jgi:hypothetical protein
LTLPSGHFASVANCAAGVPPVTVSCGTPPASNTCPIGSGTPTRTGPCDQSCPLTPGGSTCIVLSGSGNWTFTVSSPGSVPGEITCAVTMLEKRGPFGVPTTACR